MPPWALALFGLVLGCAHGPRVRWSPDARTVCTPRGCYRVGPLDGAWREVHREGSAVGFFSDAAGAVIEVNVSCRDDADAAPLPALTHHLLIGYAERALREEERVPLAGREALHTVVDARLDGVPVSLDLYVMRRDGCVFDLSYAAPRERFAGARAAFARFVRGFAREAS